MCETLEGLIEDGRKEGQFSALLNLIKSGVITLKQAAKSLNMSETKFKAELEKQALESLS